MNAIAQIPARLLVIEDDAVLSGHLRDYFSERHYLVSLCAEGPAGRCSPCGAALSHL